MIDSIFIGLSGMLGHERGLNVIGNNVSNLNTPGFRGSVVSFSDVFNGATLERLPDGRFLGQQGTGHGLDTSHTQLDMSAGDNAPTGRDLDLALQGQGFFVLQDEHGALRYTRDGSFEFNTDHQLVMIGQNLKVMARNASGQLVPIDISALQNSAAKPTTAVTVQGTISTNANPAPDPTDPTAAGPDATIDSVEVFDTAGTKHTLTLNFTKDTSVTTPGVTDYKVSVLENSQEIGTSTLEYDISGTPSADTSTLHMTLALQGADASDVAFDFSGTQAGQFGSNSNLTVQKQDGVGAGTVASETFDAQGTLKITYSNGQSADGPQLALAQITDDSGLVELGNSLFAYKGAQTVSMRVAGDDLQVQAQTLERSNVDLTREFSELILMQRGYQASSQVVSTANDMLQQLLDLRGGK